MTIKDDLERLSTYGKTPYYQAIQAYPSYQKELERVRTDWKGRSWIQSPFKLPRFTDKEFEEKRIKYQAKYGTAIQPLDFEGIFHLKIPVQISEKEMAAHNFAKKRGAPSPLTPEQIEALAGRKYRFLRALAAPTPGWLRNVNSISTFLDNSEDALITAAVLGRLVVKFAPKIWFRMVPGVGWVLVGADIINLFNITSQISFAAMGQKRFIENVTEKNPFHAKAWARRSRKLYKVWPGFGEILEIAQTTDQMFGVGLCLGAIMGLFQQSIQTSLEQLIQIGVNIPVTVQYPNAREVIWADTIKAGIGLWSDIKTFTTQELTKSIFSVQAGLNLLMPWWFKNNPFDDIPWMNRITLNAPWKKSGITRQTLEELGYDPNEPATWPFLNKTSAPMEEIVRVLGPKIKDNFQLFSLKNAYDMTAMWGGEQAVEYHKEIVEALSDDKTAQVAQTAYAQAAKEMSRDVLLIPPDTPQNLVDQLADWIGNYERRTAGSPSTKEIEKAGSAIGIEWTRSFPRITFGKAAELYPEWRAIQEQLQQLNIAD